MSAYPRARITQLGEVAHSCLASAQRGNIVAAFSEAIYLLTERGKLFWMATGDAPMHRRCVAVSALPRLQAGTSFRVENGRLVIDHGYVLDLEEALLWQEPSITADSAVPIGILPSHFQDLFSNLEFARVEGFGKFIVRILPFMQDRPADASLRLSDPILQFAEPFILDMAHTCLEQQYSCISQIAERLIGMGAGLTPSGDDFLGGLLFAVRTLRAAYPGLGFPDFPFSTEAYRSRTHLISFTLLSDLSRGHAVAPLHQILSGLIRGDSRESIQPVVSHLTQIGHSTGWDLLTGLLVGLLTAYRSNCMISPFPSVRNIDA